MHAAVWSQPIVCRKVHRCHSRAETPHNRLGKAVFCLGIGLSLLGGILSVLGLTGYFARGDTKYCLAFGGIVGLSSTFAGVIAIRAVSRKSKARSCTLAFMFLSAATWAASIAMVVLGSKVLQIRPEHLLTTILAATETTISAMISVIAGIGFFVAVKFRYQLMYPDRNDDENVDKDVPVLPQEIKSPEPE